MPSLVSALKLSRRERLERLYFDDRLPLA